MLGYMLGLARKYARNRARHRARKREPTGSWTPQAALGRPQLLLAVHGAEAPLWRYSIPGTRIYKELLGITRILC